MRVTLQLVLCNDDGREETVTDIVSWNKDYHRIEHLGLTLAESKHLLKRIQKKLLQEQIDRYVETHSQCPECGATLKAKIYQPLVSHCIWHLHTAQSASGALQMPAAKDRLVPTVVGTDDCIRLA